MRAGLYQVVHSIFAVTVTAVFLASISRHSSRQGSWW